MTDICTLNISTYAKTQNPLDVILALVKFAGYEPAGELSFNDGAIRLALKLPTGTNISAVYQKLSAVLGMMITPVIITTDDAPVTIKHLPIGKGKSVTCQNVIQFFFIVFGSNLVPGTINTPTYVQKLRDSGLENAGIYVDRQAPYTVPPFLYIEDLALSDRDKKALLGAIGN